MPISTHAHRLQLSFFLSLLLIVVVLNFFIFIPYATVLFLIVIFAIVFQPVFRKLLVWVKGNRTWASLLTVGLIFLLILLPIIALGFLVFKEANTAYLSLADQEVGSVLNSRWSVVEKYINSISPNTTIEIEQYVRQGLELIVGHLDNFFSGLVRTIFSFFLLVLGLFYLFKDGKTIKATLIGLSPLDDERDRQIFNRAQEAINSVVRGFILIALIQGFLTGIGFALFGIPAPILWGLVASIAALVPTLGTALVIAPGILYLFWSGSTFAAVGLLVWGTLAVGLIDNVLGPILMRRGIPIHPFIILLSVLGGVGFFGPIGFLAGPVTVSLLVTLFNMVPVIFQKSSAKE